MVPAAEVNSPPPQSRAKAWWSAVATFPLVLFLVTRVAYLGYSFMAMELVPRLYWHEEGRLPYLQKWPALDGLCRWDCGWFVRVVTEGYAGTQHAAVWPLFPAIGWAVEKATGVHHLLTFIILSNAASLASYYVIYRLFEELEGEAAAQAGLMLFAAYPFAYYQAAAYAESTAVLATAGAMLLARRNKFIWAGLVLGIGVMGRQLALFGGVGLLATYLLQNGFKPKKLLLNRGLLGLALPLLFIGAWSLYLNYKLGDPLAFVHGRDVGWNEWVWYGVRQTLLYVPYKERPEYFFYIAIVVIPVVGAVALFFKPSWKELAWCSAGMLGITLWMGAVGLGRYSATCWPAFLPLGVFAAKRPGALGLGVGFMTLFQGLFFWLYTHQYRIF